MSPSLNYTLLVLLLRMINIQKYKVKSFTCVKGEIKGGDLGEIEISRFR